MKIVKIILGILAALIAIFLIAGLFMGKDMAVEKSVTINKPKTVVYDYVKYLKNQDNFSKWARLDPNMKKSYTGTDGTVGFTSHWEGNSDVGKGEQEIIGFDGPNKINYQLRFKKPMESTSDAYMIADSIGPNQTNVKWGFKSTMPYPWNAMKLFMNMEEAVGKDFEEGLNNLKKIMEGQ